MRSRWESWTRQRALATAAWLVLVFGAVAWMQLVAGLLAARLFGELPGREDLQGAALLSLGSGAVAAAGLSAVWFFRRTRPWLVAAAAVVVLAIVEAVAYMSLPARGL